MDLVCIASYDEFHYQQVTQALLNRKHIYVEKPICLSRKETKKIRELLKKNPYLKISSNMVLRTCPLFKKIKKSVQKNKLGKIYNLEADYLWGRKEKILSGWRSKANFYSIIYGAAIHMVDLVLWITEKKPISVKALGNNLVTFGTKQKFNDFAIFLLNFENKMTVKISAHGGCVHPHFHVLKVFGENKSFIHDISRTVWINSSKHNNPLKPEYSAYPAKEKRVNTLISFLDSIIKSNHNPIVSKDDIFDTMSVCLAAEKAVRLGNTVSIEYL